MAKKIDVKKIQASLTKKTEQLIKIASIPGVKLFKQAMTDAKKGLIASTKDIKKAQSDLKKAEKQQTLASKKGKPELAKAKKAVKHIKDTIKLHQQHEKEWKAVYNYAEKQLKLFSTLAGKIKGTKASKKPSVKKVILKKKTTAKKAAGKSVKKK